ncbi:MAG: DUF1906 domain-containing protein [Pyrinomonadaceae bacterium]|nr:DUF1906 domain-containing protein [Pyrinomonadaceae bacterium]
MKTSVRVLSSLFAVVMIAAASFGQNSLFESLKILNTETEAHVIKNVRAFDSRSGIAFTSRAVYRTDDGGQTWNVLTPTVASTETIADADFVSSESGYVLLADQAAGRLVTARTKDGGLTWDRVVAMLPRAAELDANASTAELTFEGTTLVATLRTTSSSNFRGTAIYRSANGGETWEFVSDKLDLNSEEAASAVKRSGPWSVKTEGTCVGFKSGCYQESKLFINGEEFTPPQVAELTRQVAAAAAADAVPRFAAGTPTLSPNRISLNRGFDKCTAGTAAQMQIWWDTSWFHDANIYFSGRNRGCTQAQLTPQWVQQVRAMGWGLIPTVVGYQSPCIDSSTFSRPRHSIDPVVAETQGREEAGIAVTDAQNLGLGAGSILYYDMERYDEVARNVPGCRIATTAFLKGWTDRVRELGYESGTYGSPKNAQEDWVSLPPASKMHAIWMARWDNVMNVWTYVSFPSFPTNEWTNHQRIKQWQAPHDETWGGVTFNIDGNISDAPVVGNAVRKNQNADFDGDGKTDLSVFRPETGTWYNLTSSNGGFAAVGFGIATDIVAPGDFDGDGKTDRAVFRPSTGTWHMLLKGLNYSARQFGVDGDIPVASDYNGDGKTDIAIWRPSTGVWYIANSDSRGTFTIQTFGLAGDKPVPADYDGDGKTDLAVYRPADGIWHILRSSDGGYYGVTFGLSSDKPAQGDFDGDGKADQAIYRPSNGTWYLLQSTDGFTAFNFGLDGDAPSTGDYDGDGKADAAVFRPSNGVWYMRQSTAGITSQQFGISTDRSVPNAYLAQ